MGLLDGLESGVPGRNISKPLMIALGALLASKALGSGGLGNLFGASASPPASTPSQPGAMPGTQGPMQGGLLGGLGGLIERFQQNGLGGVVNSWVGTGPNQPISPQQVHQGLGADIIDELATRSGMPRDQLIAELSRVLPGVVDKLTPQGRVPTEAEAARTA